MNEAWILPTYMLILCVFALAGVLGLFWGGWLITVDQKAGTKGKSAQEFTVLGMKLKTSSFGGSCMAMSFALCALTVVYFPEGH